LSDFLVGLGADVNIIIRWEVEGREDSILTHLMENNDGDLGPVRFLVDNLRHNPNLVLNDNFNGEPKLFTAIFKAVQVDLKR